MKKIIPEPISGCWLWTGPYDKNGYGKICVRRRHLRTHRFVWELVNTKAIPDNLIIQHKCDTPSCINPSHLQLGTWLSNMQDKVAKGRLRNQHMGKTHCKRGHSIQILGDEYRIYDGKRCCIKCIKAYARAARDRAKARRLASNQ